MTRPVIKLKAGDDRTVPIAILKEDGSARDLTGETIEFRAAASLRTEPAAVAIYKTDGDGLVVRDAESGRIDLVFYPEDTLDAPSLLLWDLRVHAVDGKMLTLDFGTAAAPATYGLLRVEPALLLAG